ncbi:MULTISPECIES: hypothetical protein [Methanosarcina]|uniref:hypothetical protein n=1 Tax=Methanosarcina TaxID=2207 RepID=UPI000B0468DD|nr:MULTISPECIES: hypothetical protein [Methanosarcina]
MNIRNNVWWSSNSLWKVYSNSALPGGMISVSFADISGLLDPVSGVKKRSA